MPPTILTSLFSTRVNKERTAQAGGIMGFPANAAFHLWPWTQMQNHSSHIQRVPKDLKAPRANTPLDKSKLKQKTQYS